MSQYGYTELSRTTPKARIKHKCIWCGEPILPGEIYERISGVYYGEIFTNKFHKECANACQEEAREWGYDYEFSPYSNERGMTEDQADQAQRERDRLEA